jgi:hypothetical protein
MTTPIRLHKIPFRSNASKPEDAAAPSTGHQVSRFPGCTPKEDEALRQAVTIALLKEATALAETRDHDRLQAEAKARAELREHLEEAARDAGLAATQAWKRKVKALEGKLNHPVDPVACAQALGLTVVEITARIRLGQFLLRPDADLNSVAAGIIGRAQHFTGVRIGATHVLSGHLGLVVAVHSPDQLADFTNRVFGQLGDRVGRLRGLRCRIWGRRNRSIVVDPNPTDVGARLKYCLANGTKEHLVAHPSQWPGVHSAKVFCKGERMVGKWTDYTALAAARKRDPDVPESDFQTEYEVVHSKMPSLDHLSDEEYRALMVSWCDEAATDAAAVRKAGSLPEPGPPERLTRVSFEHIPESIERSIAPCVHAHDPARRKLYRQLVRDYREHLRGVRQRLTAFLAEHGLDLPGQAISPNGWRPVDPATVVPPPAIRLPEASAVAQT